jgi:hypothetical protein
MLTLLELQVLSNVAPFCTELWSSFLFWTFPRAKWLKVVTWFWGLMVWHQLVLACSMEDFYVHYIISEGHYMGPSVGDVT